MKKKSIGLVASVVSTTVLAQMRAEPKLTTMQVLRRGNRRSITPVTLQEWSAVLRILDGG